MQDSDWANTFLIKLMRSSVARKLDFVVLEQEIE